MSTARYTSLLLLPIGAAAFGAALYLEMRPAPAQATKSQPHASTEQQFEVLSYPESAQLIPLPREWPSAEQFDAIDTGGLPQETVNSNQGSGALAEQNSPQLSRVNDTDLGLSLGDIDLSSLSPDLALKVENALATQSDAAVPASLPVNDLEGNINKWQGRLPALDLQTHMYVSDAQRRWVKINDVEYYQGDVINGQITLQDIQPQAVIVEFQGEQIRIPALYEWKG